MSDIPLLTPVQVHRRGVASSSINLMGFLPHVALALSVGFVASVLCGLI